MWDFVFTVIKVLILLFIIFIRVRVTRVTVMHLYTPTQDMIRPPDSENVHDGNVRIGLWEKWKILSAEVEEDIKKYAPGTIYEATMKMPEILKATAAEKEKLKKLIMVIESQRASVLNTDNVPVSEKKIFAYCFYKYRKLRLDPSVMLEQYMSCFDEEGEAVCPVGRVSRYIGMFEGLLEGPLGRTEETENIMKQRALNRMKTLLDGFMERNPEVKKKYEEGGEMTDEEMHMCVAEIKNMFREEFPGLSNEKINEFLTAIG
jgi:hypothetical protein